jgi:serine/threonine protein kinase
MSLAAGTRLGAYEVLAAIGKGGMGEVYRARDTKLGREVAIKVLPEELAADAERVARFEREAKLLASLNHPNIASIYGFESPRPGPSAERSGVAKPDVAGVGSRDTGACRVQPEWSRDGSELFYAKDNSLLSVAIGATPTFVASSPRVLFSGPYRQWRPGANEGHTYDVSPDGRSFLMIREAEEAGAANEFVVIQNWFEELKRLVPGEN